MPHKLILQNNQSPGDIVMLLYAITSLHETYPGEYITDVRVSTPEIFEFNPLIQKIPDNDSEAMRIKMEYPQVHQSNAKPFRFSTAFTAYLSDKLQRPIKPANFAGILPISEQEQNWYSAVYERIKRDVPYWVINAGHKYDFTAKTWSFARYQELVNCLPDVIFVQIGAKEHNHPTLTGGNVINMVGQTTTRQLIRLVYNSFGVISQVSFPAHLAYAIPAHPRFKRQSRASIVLAGGREPAHWEQGPNQHFIHTLGMLPCCDHGGCWKSRVVALRDNDKQDNSLCVAPVQMPDGQWIAKCMELIEVDDVAKIIMRYMANLTYEPKK
jgi:ADP-heptose:LPS heptosyltransferase